MILRNPGYNLQIGASLGLLEVRQSEVLNYGTLIALPLLSAKICASSDTHSANSNAASDTAFSPDKPSGLTIDGASTPEGAPFPVAPTSHR
jgi:hypothetical protein